MESNEKSPIIERLCKFIESSGLTASQFADRAGIPRPSMSQMLHGRNKSLNNHVLSKLNDAFPELNIVWLLFGRGDMRSNSNFEISEAQNSLFQQNNATQKTETQQVANIASDYEDPAQYGKSSFFDEPTSSDDDLEPFKATRPQPENKKSRQQPSLTENGDADILAKMLNSKITEREPAKKIASIIVLFTDNSFETFVPSTEN